MKLNRGAYVEHGARRELHECNILLAHQTYMCATSASSARGASDSCAQKGVPGCREELDVDGCVRRWARRCHLLEYLSQRCLLCTCVGCVGWVGWVGCVECVREARVRGREKRKEGGARVPTQRVERQLAHVLPRNHTRLHDIAHMKGYSIEYYSRNIHIEWD